MHGGRGQVCGRGQQPIVNRPVDRFRGARKSGI